MKNTPSIVDDRPVQQRDDKEKCEHWLHELKLAEKDAEQWEKQAAEIMKRFEAKEQNLGDDKPKRARIDWSNAQTMLAALYSGSPKPIIKRRTNSKDGVARLSAQIWEDVTSYSMEEDQDLDDVAKRAIFDYLMVARGLVRERFEPEFEEVTEEIEVSFDAEQDGFVGPDGELIEDQAAVRQEEPEMGPDGMPVGAARLVATVTYEKLVKAKSITEYVHYKDYRTNSARVPSEIRWMAFRSYLTKEELEKHFTKEIAKEIKRNVKPAGLDDVIKDENEQGPYKKAEVWEIWNKTDEKVYWVSPGYTDGVLKEIEDPYGLKRFFPAPFPCSALSSNNTLYPTPSLVYVKDQASEIDDLTQRIGYILDGVKNVGVCDKSVESVLNQMMETDNELIGIENWQRFMQEGKLQGAVDWMPFENALSAVGALYRARAEAKALYDEISGFSDIIRGDTNPGETATAQQIKSQYADMRFDDWRREVNRFLRDAIRIKAEIIAEHFPPEVLWATANVESYTMPVEQEQFFEAVELLRNEDIRCYRIDIESDATYLEDSQAEKHNRNEFLGAVSEFIPRAIEMAKMFPEFSPVFSELLLFTARTYRPGRHFEDLIESSIQQMQEAQEQAMQEPPPPDPKMIELEQKAEHEQAKLAAEAEKSQKEFELKGAELNLKLQELALKEEEIKLKGIEIAAKYDNAVIGPDGRVGTKARRRRMVPIRDENTGEIVSADIVEIDEDMMGQGAVSLGRLASQGVRAPSKVKRLIPQRDPETGEIVSADIIELDEEMMAQEMLT